MASWEVIYNSSYVGAYVRVLESDGTDGLEAGTKYIYAPSKPTDLVTEGFHHGGSFTIKFKFYCSSNRTFIFTFLSDIKDVAVVGDNSNSLALFFHPTNNRCFFREWAGGAQTYLLTMANTYQFNTWQECRIERDLDGTYRFYVDDNLIGTSSQTTITDASYMHCRPGYYGGRVADISVTQGVEK